MTISLGASAGVSQLMSARLRDFILTFISIRCSCVGVLRCVVRDRIEWCADGRTPPSTSTLSLSGLCPRPDRHLSV
eukprot:6190024-Pleurochrysis_carterae.AAC.1